MSSAGAQALIKKYGTRLAVAERFLEGRIPAEEEGFLSEVVDRITLDAAKIRLQWQSHATKIFNECWFGGDFDGLIGFRVRHTEWEKGDPHTELPGTVMDYKLPEGRKGDVRSITLLVRHENGTEQTYLPGSLTPIGLPGSTIQEAGRGG